MTCNVATWSLSRKRSGSTSKSNIKCHVCKSEKGFVYSWREIWMKKNFDNCNWTERRRKSWDTTVWKRHHHVKNRRTNEKNIYKKMKRMKNIYISFDAFSFLFWRVCFIEHENERDTHCVNTHNVKVNAIDSVHDSLTPTSIPLLIHTDNSYDSIICSSFHKTSKALFWRRLTKSIESKGQLCLTLLISLPKVSLSSQSNINHIHTVCFLLQVYCTKLLSMSVQTEKSGSFVEKACEFSKLNQD